MRKMILTLLLTGSTMILPGLSAPAQARVAFRVGAGFWAGPLQLSLVFGQPGYAPGPGYYYRSYRPIAYPGYAPCAQCYVDHGAYYYDRSCPVVSAYFRHYRLDPAVVFSRYAPRVDGYEGYDGYDPAYGYDDGYYPAYGYDGYYGGSIGFYAGGFDRFSRDRRFDDRRFDSRRFDDRRFDRRGFDDHRFDGNRFDRRDDHRFDRGDGFHGGIPRGDFHRGGPGRSEGNPRGGQGHPSHGGGGNHSGGSHGGDHHH